MMVGGKPDVAREAMEGTNKQDFMARKACMRDIKCGHIGLRKI